MSEKINVKQLKQLQKILDICKPNTKRKDDMINNIIENNVTTDDIDKLIATIKTKKYMYECFDEEICKSHFFLDNTKLHKCKKHPKNLFIESNNEFYNYGIDYEDEKSESE